MFRALVGMPVNFNWSVEIILPFAKFFFKPVCIKMCISLWKRKTHGKFKEDQLSFRRPVLQQRHKSSAEVRNKN